MEIEKEIIERAKTFSLQKHQGQVDDCGHPYFFSHIVQVVKIIEQVTNDEIMIAAAYLHDTIEDTDTTYEEIKLLFGYEVADLVMEVTQEGKKDSKGYYFPRLITKKGITIKFADRLSNLSRMDSWSKERQEHYLKKSKFWKSE